MHAEYVDTAPTPHLKAPSTHLARLRPSITIYNHNTLNTLHTVSIPRPPCRPCTTWSKWRQHHLSMEDVAGAWWGFWHAQRRPEGKNDSALDGNSLAALRILRPCPTETHHGAIGACCCTAKQHGWHGLVKCWFWYKEIPERHGHLDPFQGHTGFCCDPAIFWAFTATLSHERSALSRCWNMHKAQTHKYAAIQGSTNASPWMQSPQSAIDNSIHPFFHQAVRRCPWLSRHQGLGKPRIPA